MTISGEVQAGKRPHAVFRTDASLEIGSGHVMRCLTLAEALKATGWDCSFISRAFVGDLNELVLSRGFPIHVLPQSGNTAQEPGNADQPSHYSWLGASWQVDAAETTAIIHQCQCDLLIVDHYAIDARWEDAVGIDRRQIMVIDDLADRKHSCGVLVDANPGRDARHYLDLVPVDCQLCIGPQFALLRTEFHSARIASLARSRPRIPEQMLIAMGGVDAENITGIVLDALRGCKLPETIKIDVVLGKNALWADAVRAQASRMPWPTNVIVNSSNMADYMKDCDIAVGAAGVTALERCCVGLPSVIFILAQNQRSGAYALAKAGAALLVKDASEIEELLPGMIDSLLSVSTRDRMATTAAELTDGLGADRILTVVEVSYG